LRVLSAEVRSFDQGEVAAVVGPTKQSSTRISPDVPLPVTWNWRVLTLDVSEVSDPVNVFEYCAQLEVGVKVWLKYVDPTRPKLRFSDGDAAETALAQHETVQEPVTLIKLVGLPV
jgi:hypothetical protein